MTVSVARFARSAMAFISYTQPIPIKKAYKQ